MTARLPAKASEQPNASATTHDFEFEALNAAVNYRRALAASFGPFLRGSVVEVGAGIGQFSRELKALRGVDRVIAVEPDARFHPELLEAVNSADVVRGTAAQIPAGTACDAIVSVNVLEHVQTDLDELQRYRELLQASRGHLCLFVPARPEIYAPIDRDFGHFRRYTLKQLSARLDSAGFDVIQLRYFNFVGYFAWWLMFRVLQQKHFRRSAVSFYDRIVFPAVFWTESRLCRPPVGQSLLAIARPR